MTMWHDNGGMHCCYCIGCSDVRSEGLTLWGVLRKFSENSRKSKRIFGSKPGTPSGISPPRWRFQKSQNSQNPKLQIPKLPESEIQKSQNGQNPKSRIPKLQTPQNPKSQIPKLLKSEVTNPKTPKIRNTKSPNSQTPKLKNPKRTKYEIPDPVLDPATI